MMFEFIDTAYSCTIIFLVVAFYTAKQPYKKYINSCITTSNYLLIFYSWYLSYQFYKLIQFIYSLNIQIPEEAKKQPIEISWFQIKFILLILLPYLFLIKKFSDSKILAIVMLVLLQWDIFVNWYHVLINGEKTSGILFYTPYLAEFKILNYICLFIGVYALLWLLKRLPNQQVK